MDWTELLFILARSRPSRWRSGCAGCHAECVQYRPGDRGNRPRRALDPRPDPGHGLPGGRRGVPRMQAQLRASPGLRMGIAARFILCQHLHLCSARPRRCYLGRRFASQLRANSAVATRRGLTAMLHGSQPSPRSAGANDESLRPRMLSPPSRCPLGLPKTQRGDSVQAKDR